MRKTNTHLQYKIRPLAAESSGLIVEPISSIKYNKYAYKINFYEHTSFDDFKELNHICEQAFEDDFVCFRSLLYIASFNDYCLALMLFERHIESVSGPINQNHIDILMSNYDCVVRPHNWYKLYDCKMEIYFNINVRAHYSNTLDELEALVEPPYKMVRSGFWNICIYNTFESARVTEAICKLTYPRESVRMYITRCLVYRK